MSFAENSAPEGKREMHELARATFAALEDADLSEVVHDLRDRVFARTPDELLETTVEGGVCHWRFKPMLELLLHHVRDLARNRAMPLEDRRGEIAATVELAGF